MSQRLSSSLARSVFITAACIVVAGITVHLVLRQRGVGSTGLPANAVIRCIPAALAVGEGEAEGLIEVWMPRGDDLAASVLDVARLESFVSRVMSSKEVEVIPSTAFDRALFLIRAQSQQGGVAIVICRTRPFLRISERFERSDNRLRVDLAQDDNFRFYEDAALYDLVEGSLPEEEVLYPRPPWADKQPWANKPWDATGDNIPR